jgi:hypothetical protein
MRDNPNYKMRYDIALSGRPYYTWLKNRYSFEFKYNRSNWHRIRCKHEDHLISIQTKAQYFIDCVKLFYGITHMDSNDRY